MLVAITGATGYVGSAVVRKLLRRDYEVRALARRPERVGPLRDLGVGIVEGDLADAGALRRLIEGAGAVIHLVGIIAEEGAQRFEAVHVEGTRAVVAAAKACGGPLVVHMSALGARDDPRATVYHRTKWAAEGVVRASGLPHAILRPSLVAGVGNVPLKMMVDMIRLAPLVPVIGDGRYEMQPVWLEDVAEAFALVLERPELRGTFELGGSERLTYHQMLDALEVALGVHRPRVRVPVGIARFAALAGAALPGVAPITPGQLQMLLEGSTTNDNALLQPFGVAPRPFAEVAAEICAPHATRPAVPA